jgi:geranylgeranyl diphosphate synthase, type I
MSEVTITRPSLTEQSLEAVDDLLRGLFRGERARWSAVDPALGTFVTELEGFVCSGGKRLRPTLVHCGFVAAGGHPDDRAVPPVAAAMELLHAFALLHDDVMDGSETRRDRPSFHAAHRDAHDAAGWRGEARRFGEGTAILGGDLLFVYADRLLAGVGHDAGPVDAVVAAAVRDVWDELRVEVTMGQHLDLLSSATGAPDTRRATLIAQYKTARYSVERPLHLGAALAGRGHEVGPALSAYGRPLGIAFQWRDDLLGAVGDPLVTGKPVGDDLREGKPTVLLALAHERATRAQRAVLNGVGDPFLDPAAIADIQAVLWATGAVAAVEERIEHLWARALATLAGAPITGAGRTALAGLADRLLFRDR